VNGAAIRQDNALLSLEFPDILANSTGTHADQEAHIRLIEDAVLLIGFPKYPGHFELADLSGRETIKSQLQILLAGDGQNNRNHSGVLNGLVLSWDFIFVRSPPYNLTSIELPAIFMMLVELDKQIVDEHILDLISAQKLVFPSEHLFDGVGEPLVLSTAFGRHLNRSWARHLPLVCC